MSTLQPSSFKRAIFIGAFGFCFASLCVFGSVAFAEGWMYKNLGLAGAYLMWTILFILLGNFILGTILSHDLRKRFYLLFPISFLAYSAGWIFGYFVFKGVIGEWVGSLAGCLLMAIVFSVGFKLPRLLILIFLILFVTNSLGYFLGSAINNSISGKSGMIAWGLIYGLCLGAGLGWILYLIDKRE